MKKLLSLSFLLLLTLSSVQAQMKIGYTNAELVLLLMPEYKTVDQQIRTAQQKYQETINIKRQYLESKMQEYQEQMQGGTLSQEDVQKRQQDLLNLQKEIEDYIEDAETQMQKKRTELLEPLANKLKTAIEEMAKEKGYDYVINANLGGGSILLHMPLEHDITIPLLKKLGVDVTPELEKQLKGEAPATAPGSGTTTPGTPGGK